MTSRTSDASGRAGALAEGDSLPRVYRPRWKSTLLVAGVFAGLCALLAAALLDWRATGTRSYLWAALGAAAGLGFGVYVYVSRIQALYVWDDGLVVRRLFGLRNEAIPFGDIVEAAWFHGRFLLETKTGSPSLSLRHLVGDGELMERLQALLPKHAGTIQRGLEEELKPMYYGGRPSRSSWSLAGTIYAVSFVGLLSRMIDDPEMGSLETVFGLGFLPALVPLIFLGVRFHARVGLSDNGLLFAQREYAPEVDPPTGRLIRWEEIEAVEETGQGQSRRCVIATAKRRRIIRATMQGYDDFVRRLRGRLDTTAANGADIPPHFPQAAVKKWELGLIAVGVFLLLVLGLPIAVDPLTSQDPLVRHVGIGAIGLILGGLCVWQVVSLLSTPYRIDLTQSEVRIATPFRRYRLAFPSVSRVRLGFNTFEVLTREGEALSLPLTESDFPLWDRPLLPIYQWLRENVPEPAQKPSAPHR